jgi:tetratricopeptide (TPR) repeat protein
LALFQGFFETAVGYLRESIVVVRDVGRQIDVPYLSSRLAAALWFSGAFDQAYTTLQKGMAIAREIGDLRPLHDVAVHHAWLDALTGRYREAIAKTTDALYLMQQISPPPDRGLATGLAGWIALAEERYIDAPQPLLECIENLREPGKREFTAWSLAGLARAELGLGNRTKTQKHLLEGLEIAVGIRAFIPLLHLMPIITLLLAEEDGASAKERAAELYGLSINQPFLAQAQLFEDIAWRQVRAAIETLPPGVVQAAQARGGALDWWETAETLLHELDA